MALAPKNTATARTPSQFTRPNTAFTIAQVQLAAGVTRRMATRTSFQFSARNALVWFNSPPFTKVNDRKSVDYP